MNVVIEGYYAHLAAAFVRGYAHVSGHPLISAMLHETPLAELSHAQCAELLAAGLAAELPLYPFKRSIPLPRVTWALGVLRTLQPGSLLDIGSGRGAFLWPLLDAFPLLPVTAIDADAQRAAHLQAVQAGGIETLQVHYLDATALPFVDNQFDVVTLLEVLEHIPNADAALAEAVRVASRFLLISVPAQADDNPEHIHLFDAERLRRMLAAHGIERVKWSGVHGHWTLLARIGW
jgi:2-polyprenyl-3-methyl-5-hydroxy-6-metoxy-1,4-benzoquinol methylase